MAFAPRFSLIRLADDLMALDGCVLRLLRKTVFMLAFKLSICRLFSLCLCVCGGGLLLFLCPHPSDLLGVRGVSVMNWGGGMHGCGCDLITEESVQCFSTGTHTE